MLHASMCSTKVLVAIREGNKSTMESLNLILNVPKTRLV